MVWRSVGTIVVPRHLGMRTGRPQRAHRVLDELQQKEGQWEISKARHVGCRSCSPCLLRLRKVSDDGVPKTRRSTWHYEVANPVGGRLMLKMC
jgi:hypothetical protein